MSVYVCVSEHVCECNCWQAMGTSSIVCQKCRGGVVGGGVGGGQRDDEEEVEIGSFSVMDAPIHQSALGSSNKGYGRWRHLEEEKHTDFTHQIKLYQSFQNRVHLGLRTCYLEM